MKPSILFLLLATLLSAGSAYSEDRPNVLFILADDLGLLDTELGPEPSFNESPNLLRLANRGAAFQNGYVAHPRCVPSRYAIQTGRFPCRDAFHAGPSDKAMAKQKTIGEAFQAGGYATFFAGKWHLGKDEKNWPHHRGYDVNVGGCHAGAPGSYFFPFGAEKGGGDHGGAIYGLETGTEGEHLTERLTLETSRWIREHVAQEESKPFFAFLSHYAVHTPIEGKPAEIETFEEKRRSLGLTSEYRDADGTTRTTRCDPAYASMVKTLDESVGAMLDLLEELSISEKTIIVFTSDHGGLSNRSSASQRELPTSNLPYRAGKGHLYEGGLRVPFVIAWPETIPAGLPRDLAITTDLFPTLLDLAGLELLPKAHWDGITLAPFLLRGEQPERKRLVWHSPLPRPTQTGDEAASAIREGRFKLVKKYFPLSLELYDLEKDPHEEVNLAAQKPELATRLQERLESILIRQGSMPPRKDWKDKSVTAPLAEE